HRTQQIVALAPEWTGAHTLVEIVIQLGQAPFNHSICSGSGIECVVQCHVSGSARRPASPAVDACAPPAWRVPGSVDRPAAEPLVEWRLQSGRGPEHRYDRSWLACRWLCRSLGPGVD